MRIGRLFDDLIGTYYAPFGSISTEVRRGYGAVIAGEGVRGELFLTHVPTVIPEPATLGLLLLGGAAITARRRTAR